MQINRTTIIQGPALVTYQSQTFWSKGNIVLKPVMSRFAIETAHAGKVDERFSDRRLQVTFEPAGRFNSALAAVLWPYGATAAGTSLCGGTDKPLVIHGRDGIKITVHNAAITQMPGIRFGVDKTSVGQIQFTGLLANSTEPSNAAAYYTVASASYPGDSGFDIGEIWTTAAFGNWGESAPWVDFLSEAGWEVAFSMQTAEQKVDGLGTVDIIMRSVDVSAKCVPVGPTMAQILTAANMNQYFGTSLAGDALTVAGNIEGAPLLTLSAAALVDCEGLRWGGTDKRVGSCEWIGCRNGSDPLFTIDEYVV